MIGLQHLTPTALNLLCKACKCRKTANLNHPAGPWQIQKHNIRNENTRPAAHPDLTLKREYTSTFHLLWGKKTKNHDRTIPEITLKKRKQRENNINYYIKQARFYFLFLTGIETLEYLGLTVLLSNGVRLSH